VEPALVIQTVLTRVADELDARTVGGLTKSDMSDFFAQFISPSSSQRAKLSVHLVAGAQRSSPGAVGYHPHRVTSNPPATLQLGKGIEADELPSSRRGIRDGRMYNHTTTDLPRVIDRIEWKSTLDRIRITAVQDISSFRLTSPQY
jgi:hypothetical protein